MAKPPAARGLRRIIRASAYALKGLRCGWRREAAFREEVLAALVLVPLALWLGENGMERALLVASLLLVLIIELLNSAIEAVVDRIGEEHHVYSGWAKDLGAAAVMLSLLNVLVVWGLVLLDN